MTTTSKQYLNLIVKQPLTKEAKLPWWAEMGLYMAPVTGELMSLRDTAQSAHRMGGELYDGEWKKAGLSGLGALGNFGMALAGIVPGGSSLRTAVRVKKLIGGARALRAVKGTNKIRNGVALARASTKARPSAHYVKSLAKKVKKGKGSSAGQIAEEGLNAITKSKNLDEITHVGGRAIEAIPDMEKTLGTYVKRTPEYKAQVQRIRAQRNVADAARASESYGRGILGQSSLLRPTWTGRGANLQGRMVGELARRASPTQMKIWDKLSRTHPFKTYAGAQLGGYGLVTASNYPEELKKENARLDAEDAAANAAEKAKRSAQAQQLRIRRLNNELYNY